MRVVFIILFIAVLTGCSGGERRFGQSPVRFDPEKEAKEYTKILQKELVLEQTQFEPVYMIYLNHFKEQRKMKKPDEDFDIESHLSSIEEETDKLRSELTLILNTNQMDKWEKFQEGSSSIRGRRPSP